MLIRQIIIGCVLFYLTATSASAQQWDKYIPKNRRDDILKKSLKASGVGAAMSGRMAVVIWVTEPVARVLVSDAIDKERLTPEEAEVKYLAARPASQYTFLVDARGYSASPFGAHEVRADVKTTEAFLQRNDDRNNFSKGTVGANVFEVHLRGLKNENLYLVRFPTVTRSSESIVRDLKDQIEVQFNVSGKKIILNYKIKDLVTRIEDL